MNKILTTLAVWLALVFGMQAVAFAATPLVDTGWLNRNLDNTASVRVIDLRNNIDGGSYETWLEGHIPGSVHSDYLKAGWRVERDGIVGVLPDASGFQSLARSLGISDDTHVVLVPAGVSSSDFGTAARAYWTFKVFGHDNVSILDGGHAAWAADFPTKIETGKGADYAPGNFTARFEDRHYIAAQDVRPLVGSDAATLLDARTPDQYDGLEKHPKAIAPGRIPGAQGLYQDASFDATTGRLKSPEELRKIYGKVDSGTPVVSYCNTGHWAAVNWFVLSEVLGRDDVRLYDGSMVEWTANADNPLQGPSNLSKIRGFIRGLVS